MNADCRQSQAAAYITEDLSAFEREEFELHLSLCAHCRTMVETTRAVVRRLRSVADVDASADLESAVLTRIHEPRNAHAGRRWLPRAAVAALVSLLAGGALWRSLQDDEPSPAQSVAPTSTLAAVEESASFHRALDWFCQHQEPDGSWDAERWGGNRRFQVALTALPVIALVEGDETRHQTAVLRATDFLRKQQRPDGTFGERFRETPYAHSVTTFALLRAYQQKPEPASRPMLSAALQVVFSSQSTDGGWGYENGSTPNFAITRWHRDVVELATSLGWSEAGERLARANRWIADQAPSASTKGEFPATDPTDYHRAYFAVASLRHDGSADAQHRLAAIRHGIVATQSKAGDASGTWHPTDQWSRVGGRLYSTALASLTLR
jgi:squalene cyclase